MDDLTILEPTQNLDRFKNKNLTETVSEFLENFLSDNTRAAYTTDFFDFAAYLHTRNIVVNGPRDVRRIHIIEYRNYLRSEFAPNTVHRKLSSLSSLFGELQNVGLIESNPVIGVKRPKAVAIRAKTGLSDLEINKLCSFYDGRAIGSLQNKALLTFLSYTGCRVSEVTHVKASDIVFENDIPVVIINGKGAKIRKIPIHPKLWAVLKELIRRREKIGDDYIFTAIQKNYTAPLHSSSVRKMLKKTLLALGMDLNKTLHSFRRGVISNLLENGHRIESVAELSGHSNINTTKGYLVREEKIEDNPLLSLNF